MPEISRFFGIVVQMHAEGGAHHVPHFHASYQGHRVVFGIDPVEILGGSLPRRQTRLVEAWAELRQHELRWAWDHLLRGEQPGSIEPLE